MNYHVVDRGDEDSIRLAEKFHKLVESFGWNHNEENPEIVLSIGGDGTMLRAFHKYISQLECIAFVGIHTGKLGFFADWQPEDLEHLAYLMHEKTAEAQIVRYPLVEIEIRTSSGAIETHLALNEFTLKGIEETLVAELHVNDVPFESFRGDGICISTPSGSTGYNKSLGGAMLHPSIEAIQIAEIASINNRVYRTLGSSMILPKHHHCDIYPKEHQMLLISLDHKYIQRSDIESVRTMVSASTKVRFARYRPHPFWNRVRDAFVGCNVK